MIHTEPVSETPASAMPTELGFGRHFADRMFTQRYTRERGWHDAVTGPYRAITLGPAAQVLRAEQKRFGKGELNFPFAHLSE